jgi:glycerol-3-phosphate dehydrogenase (NAD(P)+)
MARQGNMAEQSTILIVGYGEMGHAMETLLAQRYRLLFHDVRPVAGHETVGLEVASEVDGVIYCVPVTPLAGLAVQVFPLLSAHCVSLSVAKGLDEEGRTAPQILMDVYGAERPFGVLYGPMIAEEIRVGRPAFAQASVSDLQSWERIAGWFHGSHLALEYSTDLAGIAWAAVLKNVYALLFGMTDELQLGDNVRGYLAVAATREMQAIIVRMGGIAETAHRLAGLGDLVTTATSAGSNHHELGRRLARGESVGRGGEGTHTLSMVKKFRLLDTADYPLFQLVQGIVADPSGIRHRILDYLHMPI